MRKNIASTLIPMRKIPSNPFAFFWETLYGFRKWAFAGIGCAFILSVSKILLPVYFSEMVEYFSKITPQTFSWQKVGVYLIQMLVVFLTASLMRFAREFIEANNVRAKIRMKLSIFGLDYVANHSENYIASQKSGQLSQKIIGCAGGAAMLQIFLTQMCSCLFLISIIFFYIGRISLWFLLLTVIIGSISFKFSQKNSKILKNLTQQSIQKMDEFKGALADSIANTIIVKLFGRGKYEQDIVLGKFDNYLVARKTDVVKMQEIMLIQRVMVLCFKTMGSLLALWLWYTKKISIGDVALVLLLLDDVLANFQRFLQELTHLHRQSGELSASLQPFLVKHEIKDTKSSKNLKVSKGDIRFENITFSYDDKKKIFNQFSLDIKAKEKVGIVGLSGSGKSTLINLLQRLYDVQGGKIVIDNQNIAKVKQSSLQKNIALVPQDTSLFHRTIKQNIAYGDLAADDKRIVEASKLAYADEFIQALVGGYQSKVGEKGIKLSGGQRQRIAVARAILKDSPILLLDEATSALDNEAEQKIQKAMKVMMKGKTVIAIAHRLSTLKEMDRIIVLDKGRIIEQGTPKELIKQDGKFAKLYKLQAD